MVVSNQRRAGPASSQWVLQQAQHLRWLHQSSEAASDQCLTSSQAQTILKIWFCCVVPLLSLLSYSIISFFTKKVLSCYLMLPLVSTLNFKSKRFLHVSRTGSESKFSLLSFSRFLFPAVFCSQLSPTFPDLLTFCPINIHWWKFLLFGLGFWSSANRGW